MRFEGAQVLPLLFLYLASLIEVALVDVDVISHVNFAHFRACALFRFTFRDQNWQDNN